MENWLNYGIELKSNDIDSSDESTLESLSTKSSDSDDNEEEEEEDNLSKIQIIDKIKHLQKLFALETEKNKKYCTHMENNFKLNCSCCSKVFCCSQCHNLVSDHKLDIKYTNIICCHCDIEQNLTEYCIACDKKLKTKYLCKKCYIFDNDNKYKFHCNNCNTCHKENKDKLSHCNTCKICYTKDSKHLCINLDNDCPICLDPLKISTIFNLICGHAIHNDCYNQLIKNSYKCPLCSKTIVDMKKDFERLDNEIEQSHIFDHVTTIKEIYCNDCEKVSDTIFSYIGLKCSKCGSYNTRLNN